VVFEPDELRKHGVAFGAAGSWVDADLP
jgi:hypothetical protein